MREPFSLTFSSSIEQNYYQFFVAAIQTKILLRSLFGILYFLSFFLYIYNTIYFNVNTR